MEFIVLDAVERGASVNPKAAAVRRRFEELIRTVAAPIEIPRQRRFGMLSDGRVWKTKLERNGYRLIFTVEWTPGGNQFVIAHELLDHVDYDDRNRRKVFQNGYSDAALELPEVLEFMARLDSPETPVVEPPRAAAGLRFSLDVVSGRSGVEVTQSSAWVDDVLLPLVESGDLNSCAALADALIGMEEGSLEEILEGTEALFEDSALRVMKLGERSDAPVRRRFPLPSGGTAAAELMRINEVASAYVDPFLELHPAQRVVLADFRDRPHQVLPAAFDGPGGSGKTALLLLLAKGVLQHRARHGDDVTVHIVTASSTLAADMRLNVANHLELVEGWGRDRADATAREVCVSLDDYLLGWLDDDIRARFPDPETSKMRWPRFRDWFESSRSLRRTRITAHEAWCAIRILIDGDREGRDESELTEDTEEFNDRILNWFDGLNDERRHGVTKEVLGEALVVRRRYLEEKERGDFWDDADLADAVLTALESTESGRRLVDLVIVDEAQDLTPDALRAVVRTSSRFATEIRRLGTNDDITVSLPFLFAADDLQTVNPSGFSWGGFGAIFYDETRRMMNRSVGVRLPRRALTVNYRMRRNADIVATGLRRWMGADVDPLSSEATRPDGFSGPAGMRIVGDPELLAILVGSASRILVPDRDEIAPEELVLLESVLGPRPTDRAAWRQGRWATVLSAAESKGQEFKSAVLLGFGRHVRSAAGGNGRSALEPGLAFHYARQITYVASSRARDVSAWLDIDETDEEWFWGNSEDPNSPARHLSPARVFDAQVLGEMRESASEKLRDARKNLLGAVRNTDMDRATRAAAAAAAAAAYEEVDEPAMRRIAESVARYLDPDGTRDEFRIDLVPEPFRSPMVHQVCVDGAWSAFAGEPPADADADFLGGAAVLGSREGNWSLVNGLLARMETVGFPTRSHIVGELGSLWVRVIDNLTEILEGRTATREFSLLPSTIRFLETLPGSVPGAVGALDALMRRDVTAALGGLAALPDQAPDLRSVLEYRIVLVESGIEWLEPDDVPPFGLKAGMSASDRRRTLDGVLALVYSSEKVRENLERLPAEVVMRMPDVVKTRLLASFFRELADLVVG